MEDILNRIQHELADAVQTLYGVSVEPALLKMERTRKEFPGDFTWVTFPLVKYSRRSPEQTAIDIGEALMQSGSIASYNVVKGFLNVSLGHAELIGLLRQSGVQGRIPVVKAGQRRVMVEYSSPNTNKPLHLGHIRNNVLGYAVSNILKYTEHDVIRVNLVNDRGIHICKSMLAWIRLANGETPASSGMKGDHFVGHYYVLFDREYRRELSENRARGLSEQEAEHASVWMEEARSLLRKWEEGDQETRELWSLMNGWVYEGFSITYKRLGVEFDKYYYESDTYLLGKDLVSEGLSKKVFYQNEDGSVWADLTEFGLDQKLLLRSDGTSVYITQDLGTAQLKYDDYRMDQSVYVVGNEQDYHFKVLQLLLKKLGKPYADGIHHLSYGMVDLPHGKMKSREGTVVDADDLMDEMVGTARARTEEQGKTEGLTPEELAQLFETIGIGALKYYLLRVDAAKRMLFNPEESIDLQGNTATFIQYTYARCRSILRNAGSLPGLPELCVIEPAERAIILHLQAFNAKLEEAANSLNPSVLCMYNYELAKLFNAFYNQISILRESDMQKRALRLHITEEVSTRIRINMNLLGISVPERM